MTIPPQLLELLVCPRCKGELAYEEPQQRLVCPACRLAYDRAGLRLRGEEPARDPQRVHGLP